MKYHLKLQSFTNLDSSFTQLYIKHNDNKQIYIPKKSYWKFDIIIIIYISSFLSTGSLKNNELCLF